MIQFDDNRTTASPREPRSQHPTLALLIALGIFALANTVTTQAANLVATGSGSLLSISTVPHQNSSVGALTLRSFDLVVPSVVTAEAAVTLEGGAISAASLTPIPKPIAWLVTSVAAGASLLLARTHQARRRLVPVRNT